MRYYLAYGSNLSVEQMLKRCPDVVFLNDLLREAFCCFNNQFIVLIFPKLRKPNTYCLCPEQFQLTFSSKISFKFLEQILLTQFCHIGFLSNIRQQRSYPRDQEVSERR